MTPATSTAAMELALPLVCEFEDCKLIAYMPTPNDRPTIGWGATFHADGSPVRMGERWTQAQANAALRASLGIGIGEVVRLVATHPTTPSQLAAMAVFAFNIGTTAFAKSTLLTLHNAGAFDLAAAQFARWNKQSGVVLKGLTRRRAAEAQLYRRK